MRLSQADLDALQQATLDLYHHRDLPAFRQAAPGIFLKIIPARHFLFVDSRVDPATRRATVVDLWESSPRIIPDLVARIESAGLGHPFAMFSVTRADPALLRFADFFSLREFYDPDLHDAFHRRAGIPRRLGATWLSGTGLATLTAIRHPDEPRFTRRDHWLLDLLQPHFDLARRNAERITMRGPKRSPSLEAHGLTSREIQVAQQLPLGRTNSEIARILRIRARTVEKHIESILAKLGVENRTAAAVIIAETEKA